MALAARLADYLAAGQHGYFRRGSGQRYKGAGESVLTSTTSPTSPSTA
jgi:hypothetical protein